MQVHTAFELCGSTIPVCSKTDSGTVGGTRTCIQTHSDKSEYAMQDLQPERVEHILASASLVYFDGRLTQVTAVIFLA